MSEVSALTLDEVRARMAAVGLPIAAERLEMVRKLLADALAPVRRMDARRLAALEPAVRFDANPANVPATAAGERAAAPSTAGPSAPVASQHRAEEELCYLGIRELGTRFRRRQLSPVEVTTVHLDRIQRLDPGLHAFVTPTPERALADAKAAEATLSDGSPSPLLGIPVAYKDLYATRGIRTTAGSALLADWVPTQDATSVSRLQAAGCVMLGKLITHEFAFGIQLPGHAFPPARNPWKLDHIPGGSSSGSGAALAAGLAVGALGTDTGGSIRGPAACSGIVGLKPTYGRASRAGVITLSWTLDHTGPMARTVEDCAYLLQALAGKDPADPASSGAPVSDYVSGLTRNVRGLRVGAPREYFFDGVSPEVARAFDEALAALRRLGTTVEDVEIPSIWDAPAFMVIMLAEAFAYHVRDLRERAPLYGDVLREKLLAGGLVTGPEYVQAQRLREQLRHEMLDVLRRIDVLATPTTLGAAPPFHVVLDPDYGFPRSNMPPFNMAGIPALALPCGFTANGLPLSLQLAGRPFDEATVLRLGHAYQQATDWHLRHPKV